MRDSSYPRLRRFGLHLLSVPLTVVAMLVVPLLVLIAVTFVTRLWQPDFLPSDFAMGFVVGVLLLPIQKVVDRMLGLYPIDDDNRE